MINYTAKIALFTLIAAGIAAPVFLRAQDSSANANQTTSPAPAKHARRGAPFHGTLKTMDTNAMTLTVGSRTFQITSKTRIRKDGQPAVLGDGIVGQRVSGYYRTNDDGQLDAVSVYFGAHPRRNRANSESGAVSTNSAAAN
jgi:hypothetical protein